MFPIESLMLIIPYPPTSGNHTKGFGRRGVFRRPEVTAYFDQVLLSTRPKITKEDREFLAGLRGEKLDVLLEIYAPDRRRRDLDNVAKVVLDALTRAGVIADDGDIDRLTLVRGAPIKGGKVCVTIRELKK